MSVKILLPGMKKLSKKNKGFSFIEIIVAMFIFVIMMTATTAFFGRSMFSYRSAKAIQKDLESAQFAMNLVAKSLRTSTVVNYDTSTSIKYVQIFDYSQNKCIQYKFIGNALKVASYNVGYDTDPVDQELNKTNCDEAVSFSDSNFSAMTSGIISGSFNIIPSSDSPIKTVGRVTISMKVCPESGCSGNPKDEAKIQSTVSLRDYKEAGL